jgi:hypothetical protein
MRNLSLPAVLFALAGAALAQVGQPMPGLEIDKTFNFDLKAKSVDQLRGAAVFIEYWQTW